MSYQRLIPLGFMAGLCGACTAGAGSTTGGATPCRESRDSDSDGIGDTAEGDGDVDEDGVADFLDTDSDGDGLLDSVEHGAEDRCSAADSDGDGTPDWVDVDSDNDGLTDREEASETHSNPTVTDSDGDGVTDFGEVRGTRTDPLDSSSTIATGDFFVVLPYQGGTVHKDLEFNTTVSRADIYFLIDTTGSMDAPIDNVRASLIRIAGDVGSRIADVQMGVGHFEDFPFDDYGGGDDTPYHHDQDVTDDLAAVQYALDNLELGEGGDTPESQAEALYQVATGEGGTWQSGGSSFSIAPRVCPAVSGETAPRRGYPCFRPRALPIVVLVTDEKWHNSSIGSDLYADVTPAPHGFDHAAAGLNALGARFVAVSVESGGDRDARAMAVATGTLDTGAQPLVFPSDDGEVSDHIISGLETLTASVSHDVNTRTQNGVGNPDDFDATLFIASIATVEGYRGGFAGRGYASKDERTFYDVVPGTIVKFGVDFNNTVRPASESAEIFRASILVLGNDVAALETRQVFVVVPPTGYTIIM